MPSTLSPTRARIALVGGGVDFGTREVRVDGRSDRLTHREAELLQFLVDRAGETVSRDVLLRQVFGYQPTLQSRVVDTTVSRLRAKIESHPDRPSHLISAYGEGYRFEGLPAAPPPSPERIGVPAERTSLVGRSADVGSVIAAVAAHRRVQLVGPGGVGKTRIAVRVAAEADAERVVYVSAAHATGPAEVVTLVERTLVARDGASSLSAAVDRVGRLLDQRPTLLVVDCIEHLDPVGPVLDRWLALAGTLRIVTTSRKVTDGELVRVDCLDPDAAYALYLERARAAGGPADPDDPDAVRALVASLDHLPLAIELAAAKARSLGPSQILDRLEARLRLLSGGPRDGEPRAASLRATLDWSWDLLPDPERDVLARLSVFPGRIPLDAAIAVVGADGAARLDALVAASLVQRAERDHVLLESVRAWASEKADQRGARAEAELAHAEHYASWLAAFRPRGAPLDRDAADRMDADSHHLLAIPSRMEQRRPDLAVSVVLRLWELFQIRGVVDPYLAACDCAVRASDAGTTAWSQGTAELDRPRVLHARGMTLRLSGDLEGAERDLEAAAASAGDPATRAWFECEAAVVDVDRGRMDRADARFREFLPAMEGAVATSSRAAWAVLRMLRGDRTPEVEALLRRSLAEAEAGGQLRLAPAIRGNLGIYLNDLQRVDEALPLLTRASEELRELGATRRLISVLSGLAGIRVSQGQLEEALELSRQMETAARLVGSPRWIVLTLANQASLQLVLGDLEDGLRQLDEAEEIGRAGDLHELHLVDAFRSALSSRADRPAQARAAYDQARQRLERAGIGVNDLLRAVEAHLVWAEVRAGRSDPVDGMARVHAIRPERLQSSGARFLAALLPSGPESSTCAPS